MFYTHFLQNLHRFYSQLSNKTENWKKNVRYAFLTFRFDFGPETKTLRKKVFSANAQIVLS